MGGAESEPLNNSQNTPKIRSATSYFGQNTNIIGGELDPNNLEETIRDLQLERLYKRNPGLRASNSGGQVSLKTFLSISQPPPFIKKYGDCIVISFGLMSETPGTITVVADNVINSVNFDAGQRSSISLPVPVNCDFIVDVTPDIEKVRVPQYSKSVIICKHELVFNYVRQENGDAKLTYVKQVLISNDNNKYIMDYNKNTPIFEENPSSNCIVCCRNPAELSVGQCDHKILCKECVEKRNVRLHHCPFCGQL